MYYTNEMCFEAPDEWEDQTVNVFASSRENPRFCVVVTRGRLGRMDVEEYVRSQLAAITVKWKDLILIDQRERCIGPLDGWESRVRWKVGGTSMYQHQVFLRYYDRIIAFTASSKMVDAVECDRWLDGILADPKFRKR